MGLQLPRIVYFDRMMHEDGRRVLAESPEVALVRLEREVPEDEIWPVMASIQGYQIGSARQELPRHLHTDAALLVRCPALLVVSADGAGADTVDIPACTDAGVLVVNQAGGNREAVAEHGLALMLSVAKRIGETDQALRRDRNWHRNEFIGHELQGMTAGIIGLGHTGSRLAELCGGALGMRILAYDPYIEAECFARHGAEAVSLDTLLGESDVVSLNCPLSDETRKMIDAAALARMRRGSILVSTARGGIHDENALYDALRDGHLYGAGLDVWEDEPPALNHPLLSLPNVIASPHTAGVTVESRRRISLICAEQWLTIWRGEKPPRLLNPEAWPTYEARRLARAQP